MEDGIKHMSNNYDDLSAGEDDDEEEEEEDDDDGDGENSSKSVSFNAFVRWSLGLTEEDVLRLGKEKAMVS